MKTAVLVRSVPDTEAKLRISGNDINREDIDFIVNPYDEYAVEEAVRLKEKTGGEVDVYCLGPQASEKQLKWALSIGADEAYRLATQDWHIIREHQMAHVFGDALREKGYSFIFTGKRTIDYDMSSFPFYLGSMLNYNVMPNAVSFDYNDQEGLAVMRGLVDSINIIKKSKPPLIICCEKGLNEPRYPSLKNIMKAKKKKINTIEIDQAGIKENTIGIVKLRVPATSRKTEMLKGERDEVIKKVVHIICKEIKAI